MATDDQEPHIAHATTLSDISGVNLYTDGSVLFEGHRGRYTEHFQLNAAEVRELLRFFAALPALPKEGTPNDNR